MTTQTFLQKDLTGTPAQVDYARKLVSKLWDDCRNWGEKIESDPGKMAGLVSRRPFIGMQVSAYQSLASETNAAKIIETLKPLNQ